MVGFWQLNSFACVRQTHWTNNFLQSDPLNGPFSPVVKADFKPALAKFLVPPDAVQQFMDRHHGSVSAEAGGICQFALSLLNAEAGRCLSVRSSNFFLASTCLLSSSQPCAASK